MEELEHLARRRRRSDVEAVGAVEAERRAQRREHHLLGAADAHRERLGHRLARLLRAHPCEPGADRALDRRALLRRLGGELGLERGLELLPHPRHAGELGRPDLDRVLEKLPRIGARGHGLPSTIGK